MSAHPSPIKRMLNGSSVNSGAGPNAILSAAKMKLERGVAGSATGNAAVSASTVLTNGGVADSQGNGGESISPPAGGKGDGGGGGGGGGGGSG